MNDIAREIAKKSKSSFYYAFNLLPAEQRDAMNTVYAFCRETDDIVDEGTVTDDLKFENLRKWRIELEKSLNGHSEYLLINKLLMVIDLADKSGGSQLDATLDGLFAAVAGSLRVRLPALQPPATSGRAGSSRWGAGARRPPAPT